MSVPKRKEDRDHFICGFYFLSIKSKIDSKASATYDALIFLHKRDI